MKFNRQNVFVILGNFIARVGCTSFFHFGQFLALLPLLTAQKIKISRKGRIHLEVSSFNTSVPKILILCYIAPEIWKVADVIIFYVGLFLPLYPPNSLKESFSNWYHFTQVYIPKIMIVCYTISEIWYMIAVIIFYFGLFFALLLSNKPKNQTFKKVKKIAWIYHHFTHVHQKLWFDDVRFLPHLKKSIFQKECNSLWDEK